MTPYSEDAAPVAPDGAGRPRGRCWRLAALSMVCFAVAVSCGVARSQAATEPVTLNFVNAEIEAVARTMAAITGRTIVVDPRVKGTINLATEKPLLPQAAFEQFLAAIRLSGFSIVESAGLLKLVPEADAKLQGGSVSVGAASTGGNQVVTQIIPLSHEIAANLVPILRPLISPNNTINVNPGSNALVITDYADNVRRLARIIAALDVSNATDAEVIPLRHALASDLVAIVQRLLESSGAAGGPAAPGQADTSYRTTLIAEPRSNALIVRAANAARLGLARTLIQQLDQPISQDPSGNIHVVHLKNADAMHLATVLRAALSGTAAGEAGAAGAPAASGNTTGSAPTAATGASAGRSTATPRTAAQPSTGGQVQADPATNSLIITAPEPQYRQLRAVIDLLDGRRAQIFIESVIVEVNEDKSADFGIQWQGVNQVGNLVSYLGTNFGSGSNNIVTLNTTSSSDASSLAVGKGANFGLAYKTHEVYVLGFLARALQENGDGNVLSTPNLLTLDNEEASMVVGQNVPFVTGQYTNGNSGSGNSANPFQTIERKDVGLTLKVKPQIGENGTIRMQIYQEVSSVQPSTASASNGPTTNKRAIDSTVLVQDGGIVVLGGLMQDEYTGNQEKVPVAGDLPLLGNLFRSSTRSRKKTNLMVFIRPVILRDAAQAESLSLDRYGEMRGQQAGAQPESSRLLPVEGGPILPDRPAH